mmetsp:Transcript_4346/g.10492  ORF Transcript_4346/g.10492 Transcript_4346/m.10492 type:complete len:285 (-) Transcript_4346:1605-2459(-)
MAPLPRGALGGAPSCGPAAEETRTGEDAPSSILGSRLAFPVFRGLGEGPSSPTLFDPPCGTTRSSLAAPGLRARGDASVAIREKLLWTCASSEGCRERALLAPLAFSGVAKDLAMLMGRGREPAAGAGTSLPAFAAARDEGREGLALGAGPATVFVRTTGNTGVGLSLVVVRVKSAINWGPWRSVDPARLSAPPPPTDKSSPALGLATLGRGRPGPCPGRMPRADLALALARGVSDSANAGSCRRPDVGLINASSSPVARLRVEGGRGTAASTDIGLLAGTARQ